MRCKRGSVTRRHFLGVTGLGLATAVMAQLPGLFAARAWPQDLGTQMSIATWPNYHDPATFETFTAETGVAVEVNVFGSNEEMLAKLQAGGTGWDLFVPTNYTISTYEKLGLIDPLDLSKLPNFDAATQNPRFTTRGHDRRQDLCRAEELGHDRHRRQHRQDEDADDDAGRSSSRSRMDRGRRPRHGARLSADHDRQRAGLARLLASTRSSRTNSPRPRSC